METTFNSRCQNSPLIMSKPDLSSYLELRTSDFSIDQN